MITLNQSLNQVVDLVSSQHTGASIWNCFITLIICTTIVVCVYYISKAVRDCVCQSYNAKLQEQNSRQDFEKEKMSLEKESLLAKWEHEDNVRVQAHDWENERNKGASNNK